MMNSQIDFDIIITTSSSGKRMERLIIVSLFFPTASGCRRGDGIKEETRKLIEAIVINQTKNCSKKFSFSATKKRS